MKDLTKNPLYRKMNPFNRQVVIDAMKNRLKLETLKQDLLQEQQLGVLERKRSFIEIKRLIDEVEAEIEIANVRVELALFNNGHIELDHEYFNQNMSQLL